MEMSETLKLYRAMNKQLEDSNSEEELPKRQKPTPKERADEIGYIMQNINNAIHKQKEILAKHEEDARNSNLRYNREIRNIQVYLCDLHERKTALMEEWSELRKTDLS